MEKKTNRLVQKIPEITIVDVRDPKSRSFFFFWDFDFYFILFYILIIKTKCIFWINYFFQEPQDSNVTDSPDNFLSLSTSNSNLPSVYSTPTNSFINNGPNHSSNSSSVLKGKTVPQRVQNGPNNSSNSSSVLNGKTVPRNSFLGDSSFGDFENSFEIPDIKTEDYLNDISMSQLGENDTSTLIGFFFFFSN